MKPNARPNLRSELDHLSDGELYERCIVAMTAIAQNLGCRACGGDLLRIVQAKGPTLNGRPRFIIFECSRCSLAELFDAAEVTTE